MRGLKKTVMRDCWKCWRPCMLLLLATFAQSALAEAPPLFANADRAVGALATNGQGRIARVVPGRLAALRSEVLAEGAGRLRLNLPNGVEQVARLERSAPTASGYTLSGPLEGVPFGRAVLVVNEGVTMGRIYTPEGKYRLEGTDGLLAVEPMAPQPRHCETVEPPAGLAMVPNGPVEPGRQPSAASARSKREGTSVPADVDGSGNSVVDVLVVYPSFVRDMEGGYARMLAMIDLDIATANEAYAASGINLRVALAAAVEVEYDRFKSRYAEDASVTELWRSALGELSGSDDGHMDEVHALRDRHAADLVLLHFGGATMRAFMDTHTLGIAYAPSEVSRESVEAHGFSVALSGDGTVVAHELGHSMGLLHDRREDRSNLPFPYSHGFRYELPRRLEDGTKDEVLDYGTIMSQYSGADYWRSDFVLAFSNPDLAHPAAPDLRLGVAGDDPSSSPDGPADAARHLNELRATLAGVRDRADADSCIYMLSGDNGELPAAGGTFEVQVETQPGCPWVAAGGEWVQSVLDPQGSGSGRVRYMVARNDGFRRTAEVLVAGRAHARPQAGSRPVTPVCERSGGVRNTLVQAHPDYREEEFVIAGVTQVRGTDCRSLDFDAEYLASFRDFRLHATFDKVVLGDFDGLTGVTHLFLGGHVTRLQSGLLSGLPGLRVLWFGAWFNPDGELEAIEPGAFRGLAGLRKLDFVGHKLGELPPGAFEGLSGLLELELRGELVSIGVDTGRVVRAPRPRMALNPGTFKGLGELRYLWIRGHELAPLEAGTFAGMPELPMLDLYDNRLEAVAAGAFRGLASVETLLVQRNRLARLPRGAFDGLPSLRELSLWNNRLSRLPDGLFEGLDRLEELGLASNRLASLRPDIFAGLGSLESLNLEDNPLSRLTPGVFRNLESLEALYLRENRHGALRRGTFEGLDRLNRLWLSRSHVTSLPPGLLGDLPALDVLVLEGNRLHALPPDLVDGRRLSGLRLAGNPGAPFTFAVKPVAAPLSPGDVGFGEHLRWRVEMVPGAPDDFEVLASASNAEPFHGLSDGFIRTWVSAERDRSEEELLLPDGDEEVVVRVESTTWQEGRGRGPQGSVQIGDVTFGIDYGYGYSGMRVVPGPPLVLQGFQDANLKRSGEPTAFELASAFPRRFGQDAEYSVATSDDAVAAVRIEDGTLLVTPTGVGAAEVSVTATLADGSSLVRRFSVTVGAPSVPLLVGASDPGRVGFARLLNRSERAGRVQVTAIDDGGTRRGAVSLRLPAHGAVHFNSRDLEAGNAAKGMPDGVGAGEGDWRLEIASELDVEALSYVRMRDGYVAGLNQVAPTEDGAVRIATFAPAGDDWGSGLLRVVNPGGRAADVVLRGVDDAGAASADAVRLRVPAGASRTFTAAQLEAGGDGLEGALGDGEGFWRLAIESSAPVQAMSLMEEAPAGRLSNLSLGPLAPDPFGVHHLPLLPLASERSLTGVVRVVNRSPRAGSVTIRAFDGAGAMRDPVELSIEAGGAAHFSSEDLELGGAGTGLSGSIGPGEDGWRLELESGLDIGVLAYARTEGGLMTALHGTVPKRDGRQVVRMFNPGSNHGQVSVLRIANPHRHDVKVTVIGTDDAGGAPPGEGYAWVTVPAGGAVELDAAALEAGVFVKNELHGPLFDYWKRRPLGDGAGKWRLAVTPERDLMVQSLLETPTGHLVNLSSVGQQ